MTDRIGLAGLKWVVFSIAAAGCLSRGLVIAAGSGASEGGAVETLIDQPIGEGVLESLPGESLPGESLPGESLPGESLPGESLPVPFGERVITGAPVPEYADGLWGWFPTDGWESSAEFGLNGATGNTESLTVQTGARLKRKTEWNAFELRLLQNRTQSAGLTSQNNVLLYGDFERSIGPSPWNWFVKQGLEYDELRAFDLRYFVNSGLGYKWIEGDGLLFSTRFGAGASREFGGPDDQWTPEALLGATYEHQINPRNKIVAKIDYYPALNDLSDFRTITDMYWELLLSEKPNLSLKLGALHRHDSQPGGALPNDLNYSALMLYKF